MERPASPADHALSLSAPPRHPAQPIPDLATVLATGERGDYAAAVRLGAALPEDQRGPALASVFGRWASQDRSAAATAALALTDTLARDIAWSAVVQQWAPADPATLASYASDLPPGAVRNIALDSALGHWLESDPPAAIAWVEALPSSPEDDVIVARIAQHPGLIGSQPELAIAWAEAIRDPVLRSRTLGTVVREWRDINPAAAEHYARTSPELTPGEREDILVGERFTPHP
ncbi:hypothetical protein D187_009252 [Cystobacter fuscus DSM 2262]|uniref:Uncharacterized protein n=1 Tax=Cystobacter fuscus (strain ATCC 25194 / DSM 2262 / NBRC 100088 / M29) TaxID=1242864 RepID=S9NXR5_CYSF2|nr:hypothetical protein D187_009252 [Cystobacter fuscus DSM 2262]